MKTSFTFLFIISFFLCQSQSIDAEKVQQDIRFLSDDKLKGRNTGTQEELIAAKYIANQFEQLGLQPKGKDQTFFYPFTFKKTATIHDTTNGIPSSGVNVIAYLDNKAKATVVIGAHFDHLGVGEDGHSLAPEAKGQVHNGADDNASGTAGVIALARYFSKNDLKEEFNFLFICFSGEEHGLIGSKKFCEQPTIPFSDMNYMINMDMIGRLNDSTQKLIIYGVGTAKEWVPLLDQMQSDFSIKQDSAGIGPSDQTSFYLKNVPVLHFFTGQHSDYHKPGDDYSKLNFKGEIKILQFIVQLIERTETLPKLTFQTTRNPNSEIRNFKVTMGVMPDYAYDGAGMRIDDVINGRAAFKAGLEKGDIVIKMADRKIGNLNDYMKALYVFEKGQTIQLTIVRNKKELKLNLTF